MDPSKRRHPVKNFFIVTRLQRRHIFWVMGTIVAVMLVVLGFVALGFALEFRTGAFGDLPEPVRRVIVRQAVHGLIFPSLVCSLVSVLGIGLYVSSFSSRKMALPVFKIRKWAESLLAGDLTHEVSFRTEDRMEELAFACNQVTRKYREVFVELRRDLEDGKQSPESKVEAMRRLLAGYRL